MISKFALLSNILLATAALAAPSSLVEDPLAHRSEDRQSLAIKGVMPRADNEISEGLDDWAGTIWSPNSVRVIPMVHDHVRSHLFADSIMSAVSKAPSTSPTFIGILIVSILLLVSTAHSADSMAPSLASSLASPSRIAVGGWLAMVRDVELPL